MVHRDDLHDGSPKLDNNQVHGDSVTGRSDDRLSANPGSATVGLVPEGERLSQVGLSTPVIQTI